jgi:hypothetical protein
MHTPLNGNIHKESNPKQAVNQSQEVVKELPNNFENVGCQISSLSC